MLDLDAYFRRIGYSGSRAPTLETLAALHLRHALAIPFENLDPLRGVRPRLDVEALEDKIVRGRRGGYCFEQNLLFTHALRALGFGVTALTARVLWQRPASNEAAARTHMLLLVEAEGSERLCDVGFGGLTMTAPLALTPEVEQRTPHEPFRLVERSGQLEVQAQVGAEWRPLYRFDLAPQLEVDIEVLNFYVAEYPRSTFRAELMAARRAKDRTFALRNRELSVHTLGGGTERRQLESVAELRRALAEPLAIDVPADPALDAALERVLAR